MASGRTQPVEISSGPGRTLRLDFPAQCLVTVCDLPRGRPLSDVREATAAALRSPLGFPPLSLAAVPGDKVTLAVGPHLPQARAAIAAIVECLLASGPADLDLCLLLPAEGCGGCTDPVGLVAEQVRSKLRIVRHDPDDSSGLMYIAAMEDARPLYLNRALGEADVVIHLGQMHPADALGYFGVFGDLGTAFSDSATQAFFRRVRSFRLGADRQTKQHQADQAGRLLGGRFAVQLIPGSAGEVLHVLAGDVAEVAQSGQRWIEQAWGQPVTRTYGLVLAEVQHAGGPPWLELARAMKSAGRALAEGGTLVLVSPLTEPPGKLLRQVALAETPTAALRLLRGETQGETAVAAALMRLRRRGRVGLLSPLSAELVESTGLVAVDHGEQIARLAQRAGEVLVVKNAQSAQLIRSSELRASIPLRRRRT